MSGCEDWEEEGVEPSMTEFRNRTAFDFDFTYENIKNRRMKERMMSDNKMCTRVYGLSSIVRRSE